jgi:hypothetical protein
VKRRKVEDVRKVQTIQDCINNRVVTWPTTSSEYVKRHDSIMNMIISTGYPASMLDQPSVDNMMITLDGRRNRMLKSMEMRAFLKLNKHVC